jgi:CBS domain containing-hemolysin-like protein
MSQTPTRSDPPDSEHRGLPMVVAQLDEPQEGWLTRVMRILFGWKAAATRADLEHVLTAEQPQSGFSPEEAAMLKNILGLRECRIESVMVPRADIVAVQQDIAIGELVRVFEVAAHSRLVVYNDTLDDPTGMIHIRDLIAFMAARASANPAIAAASETPHQAGLNLGNVDLATPLSAAKIVREILYAPPSMPVLDLLAKMQATRIHLALIIDEYGGTDGLVSMDGSFLANGRASLDDVRAVIGDEFDVGDAAQEVDTLGGYLVIRAGHVPVRGELVPGPETFEAEVLDADPRRVKRARIYRRKDRRPAAAREQPAAVKAPAVRPAPSPEANRPNTNAQRTP